MNKYSQNNEQDIILDFFQGEIPQAFLDIGAFHPFTFSNTRALFELGWLGTFVEPSPNCLKELRKEYGENEKIQIIDKAIDLESGLKVFFDSKGDAISTLDPKHADKWTKGYSVKYDEIYVECITPSELISQLAYDKYAFVNIDIEGDTTLNIFRSLDLNALGARLVCVEHNGIQINDFVARAKALGFHEIHRNGENLIFGR